MESSKLSQYAKSLSGALRKRYEEKISAVGIDPYLLSDYSVDVRDFPPITYIDIVNYLVLGVSAYTKEDFKSYKSLAAYKNYKLGFVKAIGAIKMGENILLIAQVTHSQRLRIPPAKPWVIVKLDGEIMSAHCDCMAGLGECCSHVGSCLFAVEDIVRKFSESESVTDVKAYWKEPSSQLGQMSKVHNVRYDFSSSDEDDCSGASGPPVKEMDDEEFASFLKKFADAGLKPVVFLTTPPYCDEIESKIKSLPEVLFQEENAAKDLDALIKLGKSLTFSISDPSNIEKITRGQAKNPKWQVIREGRITASVMKAVCRAKKNKPPLSLIKRICYPRQYFFKSAATAYGCKHEAEALKNYSDFMNLHHDNFTIRQPGFIIRKEFPELGASPDALIECSCCGEGCVEVKCPYCAREGHLLEEVMSLKEPFLTQSSTATGQSTISLSRTHTYFYQVQMQMALSGREYCDFVVWKKTEFIHERVIFDQSFWDSNLKLLLDFYYKVIVPEMLGKYFTRRSS